MAPPGEELLDMIGQRTAAAANPPYVILARKLDQLRSGNVAGEVARVPDLADALCRPVQDERWRANRGQDLPNIDFAIHLHDCECRARACLHAKIASHAFGGLTVSGQARRPQCHAYPLWRAPIALDVVEERLPLLVLPAERVVWGPTALCVGAIKDQCRCTLRIRGAIKQRHRPALGYTDQRRPLGTHLVEYRPHVVHALLEREILRTPVGHSGAALVE